MTGTPPIHRQHRRRALRGVAAVALAAAGLSVLGWLLLPIGWNRSLLVGSLQVGQVVYVLALVAALAVFAAATAVMAAARSRNAAAPRAALWALASGAMLLMVVPIELMASRALTRAHGLPQLPTTFAAAPPRGDAPPVRTIVVVGESSARGEPYDVSIASIAAWQLDKVFPGTLFNVDMRARGGLSLEQAIRYLADLQQRPDAVLIYSGHNEFQARYPWSRNVAYYADEASGAAPVARFWQVAALSPFYRLLDQRIDSHRLDRPPPPRATRELVDRPAFTADEYAALREDFRMRLDHLLDWCQQIDTVPIVVIPAGNDVDFPPSRSYLDPITSADERRRFAGDVEAARAMETDGADARGAYQSLIERQPLFAEAHYRYARLLQKDGASTADHFARARDLDGMPMRMPDDFQAVARRAALDHGAIVVDTQRVLDADHSAALFHDAQHPTLAGYVAIAQDLLEQLRARHAFGWPDAAPVPTIDVSACARHFGIDRARWARIFQRTAEFYGRIAYIRFDPAPHLDRAVRYEEAARRLASDAPLDGVDFAALGLTPEVVQAIKTAPRAPADADAAASGEAQSGAGVGRAQVPVAQACRDVGADLISGDGAAWDALPLEQRTNALQDAAVEMLFACLAVARDAADVCEHLPEPRREPCRQQWQIGNELKDMLAASLKPQLLYRTCLQGKDKANCDRVLEAITTHNAGLCEGLDEAPDRSFCTAIATGDPAPCESFPLGAQRGFCAALATDDPAHCPREEAADCRNMARAFATWKVQDPDQATDLEPIAAAIRWRKPSYCAPLVTAFEQVCSAWLAGR